jgi:hypothetical protein
LKIAVQFTGTPTQSFRIAYWRYEGKQNKKGDALRAKLTKKGMRYEQIVAHPLLLYTLPILWAVLGGDGKRFLASWGPSGNAGEHQVPQSRAIVCHLSLLSTPQASRWTLSLNPDPDWLIVFDTSVSRPAALVIGVDIYLRYRILPILRTLSLIWDKRPCFAAFLTRGEPSAQFKK